MQYINKKSHYATLISSLNKEYFNAKIGKIIKPNNIYMLDIIYDFLNNDRLTLTNTETKQLLSMYNNLLYSSKNICINTDQISYNLSKPKNKIQADRDSCNNLPPISTIGIIYYWQEESYLTTIEDIIPLTSNEGYFDDKLSDSYSNFENIGKTINYEYVGRLCFYATESDNQKFIVTDFLNNDVTDIFDIVYLIDSNSTLFVSKDFYSNSDIFFKFKKTNIVDESIFTSQFNSTFQ